MCGFVRQIGDPVFISHYHIQKNKGSSGQKLHLLWKDKARKHSVLRAMILFLLYVNLYTLTNYACR